MTYASKDTKDKAIAAAKRLAEEDAAKAEGREPVNVDEIKEETDNLLDEIDSLLEGQEVLANFRQKGGQ